jgi:DNA polymerase-1
MYAEYKANRSAMPEDLQPQIPMIIETLEAFGVPVLTCAGWEADDIIATVVKFATSRDVNVSIVTTDKDARQLLGPRVRLFNARKNSYLGVAELQADWGIGPHQVIDFQALVGDAVDNIPGVPLIGPKTAATLLQQFGDLENVLAHAHEAKGAKTRENLKQYADQARVSRQLARLYDDLPIEVDWDRARSGQLNVARLRELFAEFGFRRFADEILALQPEEEVFRLQSGPADTASGSSSQPQSHSRQRSLFDTPTLTRTWEIVDTPEKFAVFAGQLRQQRRFCLDLETTSVDAVRADIVGWAFSWGPGHGWYLPVQGPAGQAVLDAKTVVEALRPHLEDPATEIINQNIKYDMLVLRRAGIEIRNVGLDPMVGSYLLDAGARSHGLDELAKRYLKHTMIPITELIGTGKNQCLMSAVDVAKVAEYAVEDAEIAWQLADLIERELRSEGLWDLYWEIERPLIQVLADMEHTGIRVEPELLREQSLLAGEKLEIIKQQIYDLAGRKFNIDSPLQLRKILFEELHLPVMKKTKTGASTDQEVLEKLELLHPLPKKLMEHRRLSKLKNTYLDALPLMINPETGRIHASFNQVVAATGRLSSSDPNLQNIPIRTEEGRRVREAFRPAHPEWKLLCADYSQIELRMLAHFSHDAALVQAFADQRDIHTAVAADIFQVELAAVDSEMRRIAKMVNFGVIYGQSAFGLATVLGIKPDEAAKFIDEYFSRYAGVEIFLRNLLEACRKKGYAETIRGRRRAVSDIRQFSNRRQLNLPERTAINAVIQGSAADLIKLAMINVHRRLRDEGHPARLLLQIHDELVLETPPEHVSSLARLVREEMEHALSLDVPLKVDVSAGADWLNVESVAEET